MCDRDCFATGCVTDENARGSFLWIRYAQNFKEMKSWGTGTERVRVSASRASRAVGQSRAACERSRLISTDR